MSFFAKVPRGVLWAAVLLALIVVQVLLGVARTPGTAGLHGMNALFVFAVALVAGYAARARAVTPAAELGGSAAVTLGASRPPPPRPSGVLDLLRYGSPAPLGLGAVTRTFDYVIGRRPGFLDGTPGFWWTINGRLHPDVPMFPVVEGDVVRMRIVNDSGEVHPMHRHGHHLVVLARDGVAATGSPWWVDSLDVAPAATYDVAFVADSPGIWADHCHNLPQAAEGLVTHVMYEGVHTPYLVGGAAGKRAGMNRAARSSGGCAARGHQQGRDRPRCRSLAPMERVEVQMDAATVRYLRACAGRGGSVAAAAARQLRELALADGVARMAEWAGENPSFFDDAEAERDAALNA